MKSYLFLIIIFLFELGCAAQDGDISYDKGIEDLDAGQYVDALMMFEKATTVYRTDGNKMGFTKAVLQATKIKINNKKFKAASKTIEELVAYYSMNQLANDSLWVEIMNTKALNLKHLGQFENALAVNDQLLNNENVSRQYADRIYHLRSRIEMDLGNYSNAIASAKKSLEGYVKEKDSSNQAAIYNIIGVGLYFQDKLDSTLVYYNKSLQLKEQLKADNYELAISTFNIGTVYEATADYDRAIFYYKQAEKYDLLDGGEVVGVLSDIYVAMVNSYYSMGDYGNAEIYSKKALQLASKVYGENSTYSSFVYVSYANLLELKNQRREAIEYIKKALEIRKKTYGYNHRWTFESYLDLGNNYLLLKELDSARVNLHYAFEVAKRLNSKVSLCYSKKVLGELQTAMGKHEDSQKLYQEAKRLSNEIYGENHDLSLEIQYLLAESYFFNKDIVAAKNSIEWFKKLYAQNNNSLVEFFIPDILDLENRIYAQGLHRPGKKGFEREIMTNILAQVDIINSIRNRYAKDDSKMFVGKERDKVIANAIALSYRLYEIDKKDSYLETAFKMSELNRNNILLEGIQKTRFQKMAGIPDHILEKENKLIQNIELTKKEIHYAENASDPVTKKIDSLLSVQLVLNDNLEEHLNAVKENYPDYFSLKYAREPISIDRLQHDVLKANQTFIEYYVGDKDTYLFVIEKTSKKMLKISKSDRLREKAVALRSKAIERKDVSEEAQTMFELLLGDLKVKKNLIVVTDNFLNDIPFEILQNGAGQLIKKHLVSYSGSANLLSQQKQTSSLHGDKLIWCGFAPEFELLDNLPSTKDEIIEIAKIMGGKMFSGKLATLENFKEEAARASIIHLATHTTMDNLNPKYNKLHFAKDTLNSELTTSDIYALSLDAELAVLSACNTGYGKFEKGEGTMNMARAFKYAGVESTIMSLWKVPDKQTTTIMVSFYRHLKMGLPKNEALQKAKLDYLASTDDNLLKHPYYWAGFVVSGNTDPISDPISKWWWLLVIPAITVPALYRIKRKSA